MDGALQRYRNVEDNQLAENGPVSRGFLIAVLLLYVLCQTRQESGQKHLPYRQQR